MSLLRSTAAAYLVRWHALKEKQPALAAAALGVCLGPPGLLCVYLTGKLVFFFLPPELWGNSAAANLARATPLGLFLALLFYAPLLETFMGQLLPMELARRLGARPAACVLLSGLLFGCGHYLNGGVAHGLTTFVGGSLFACAYTALRPAGAWPAFVAAASMHATHNGILFVFMVFSGAG